MVESKRQCFFFLPLNLENGSFVAFLSSSSIVLHVYIDHVSPKSSYHIFGQLCSTALCSTLSSQFAPVADGGGGKMGMFDFPAWTKYASCKSCCYPTESHISNVSLPHS